MADKQLVDSGVSIKTAYEGQPNTNAFTDTEKTKLAGIASGAQVNTVNSVAGKTGAVTLVKADVGLGNVDNTSDANKPVSTAVQNALDDKLENITGLVTAGSNISITGTGTTVDPYEISASGGGGGSVDSVNGQTGVVVIDADDIDDAATTNKFVTATDITKLGNLSGVNTGDQTSVTGNAGTATALQNARTIGGVSFDGTANIVPQTIQMVNDASDTTCFILFGNASGAVSQQPKTNNGLTYNASTNNLGAATFTGALVGNVTGNVSGSSGSTTGNAATATALETGRTINGTTFDGTGNITVTAAAATLTGTTLNSAVVTSSLTAVGTISTGVWNGTVIGAAYGGTGQTSYAVGDILYASGANVISKLAGVATGNALISGGVTTAPSWGKIGLTTHVSGTLPVGNGGTGATILTGIVKGNGTSAFTAATAGADYVTPTGTETLTNKRINPRVGTTASSSTPTPNADTDDIYTVTALAAGATFGAPTGTPVQGQALVIRIKDNGTARSLAYNAIYRALGVTLPTTTVINKTLYLGMVYNSTDTKWDVTGVSQEA